MLNFSLRPKFSITAHFALIRSYTRLRQSLIFCLVLAKYIVTHCVWDYRCKLAQKYLFKQTDSYSTLSCALWRSTCSWYGCHWPFWMHIIKLCYFQWQIFYLCLLFVISISASGDDIPNRISWPAEVCFHCCMASLVNASENLSSHSNNLEQLFQVLVCRERWLR